MTEKNEQYASRWVKNQKSNDTGECIMIAWNQFSGDIPEHFIFGFALLHVAISYVDDTRLGQISNAKLGTELCSKGRQVSGPNLTKRINVGLHIWVQNYLSKFWSGKQNHGNKFWQKIIMYELRCFGCQKSNAILGHFYLIKVSRIRKWFCSALFIPHLHYQVSRDNQDRRGFRTHHIWNGWRKWKFNRENKLLEDHDDCVQIFCVNGYMNGFGLFFELREKQQKQWVQSTGERFYMGTTQNTSNPCSQI